jgi:hypothetical protein
MIATLTGMRQNLNVVLICLSLMVEDNEHLVKNILAFVTQYVLYFLQQDLLWKEQKTSFI